MIKLKLSELSKYYQQHHFLLMGTICFFNIFFFSWFNVYYSWGNLVWSRNLVALVYQVFYGAIFLYFYKMYVDARKLYKSLVPVNEEEIDKLLEGMGNEIKT